jgi:hypothetical protein
VLEKFIEHRFHTKSRKLIATANTIIADYQAQGFTLTLRQLYYQFVSRDVIPNSQNEYKRLGQVINDARLAGLIDWSAIEDRTRNVRAWGYRSSPDEAVRILASQYAENAWATQPRHVEVWIEKDALIGVVEPVCGRYRLPFFACRGYSSQSEQYDAGKRFAKAQHDGRKPLVLHLGDHDPSGMDMTRDNRERLAMFARHGVEVKRLALNMDQIEKYDPPPNPAKESDSRAGSYIEQYGESSWELDALSPLVIDKLIEKAVKKVLDKDAWATAMEREAEGKATLKLISDSYSQVKDFVTDPFERPVPPVEPDYVW